MQTLGLGLMHGRLSAARERRRSLRLTDDRLVVGGCLFRGRLWGALAARWDEIAEMTVTEREADIRTRRGRHRRLNLADRENAAEVRAALKYAQKRLAASTQEGIIP